MTKSSIFTKAVHAGDDRSSHSVGVEDLDDLIADITQALDTV